MTLQNGETLPLVVIGAAAIEAVDLDDITAWTIGPGIVTLLLADGDEREVEISPELQTWLERDDDRE